MANLTLQMAFDSSYIDFKIDELNLLHKVSLLNVGNSYLTRGISDDLFNKEIQHIREFLLPYKSCLIVAGGIIEKDFPTHLIGWKIKNVAGKVGEIKDKITVKIAQQNNGTIDNDQINEYYVKTLEEQLKSKENLVYDFTSNNHINITIDEEYTDNKILNKSNGVIAQLAQKLVPYNYINKFLYLSNEDEVGFAELKSFYSEFTDDAEPTYVWFPYNTDTSSIWHFDNTTIPVQIQSDKDFWKIEYPNEININGIDGLNTNKILYTKATRKPGTDIESGNVTIRKEGKYVGKVTIGVEQDNDWKFNFADELSRIIDLRKPFLNGDITPVSFLNILDYYILPFKNINVFEKEKDKENKDIEVFHFWQSIKHLLINTLMLNTQNLNDPEEFYRNESKDLDNKEFVRYNKNVKDADFDKKLKWMANELFIKSKIKIESTKDITTTDNDSLEQTLSQVDAQLRKPEVQCVLFSVITKLDFSKIKMDINTKIELQNNTLLHKNRKNEMAAYETVQNEQITETNIDFYSLFNLYLFKHAKTTTENKTHITNYTTPYLRYLLKNIKNFKDIESIKNILTSKVVNLFIKAKDENEYSLSYNNDNKKFDKYTFLDEEVIKNTINDEITRLTKTEEDKNPTKDQIPIRIQIGDPFEIAQKTETDDDLSDEICGYVLLSTRSNEINSETSFNDWKYHNWAKVKTKTDDITTPLNSAFLIPSQLPEENGINKIFLEISNEKASLTATLESLNHIGNIEEQQKNTHRNKLEYYLLEDRIHNPYSLLYGYNYKFAAFAILNSGVLPEELRIKKNTLNQFNEIIEDSTITDFIGDMHYLRTKEVAPPNIKLIKVKDYPKELNPLYYELFSEDDKKENKLIIIGDNFNEEFSINIEKPRTTFWDCYSFVRDQFVNYKLEYKIKDEEIIDYIDPSVFDSFYIAVQCINSHNEIDDPIDAVIKYKKDSTITNNFSQTISVALGTEFKIENNKLTLKSGNIYSIKFYNLIEKKYFDNIADKKFDKDRFQIEEFKDYYKIAPEEIKIEAAFIENAIAEEDLWNAISIIEEDSIMQQHIPHANNTIKAVIDKNSKSYYYYSRVEVQHQLWDWNGRQININISELKNESLNPSKGKGDIYDTTEAMKFEAWTQSERPDYTSFKSESKLLASISKNIIHEFKTILDNHAIYLKYSVEIFNRYESLGGKYKDRRIKSKIPVQRTQDDKMIKNQWKRYLKKSKRTEQLPPPSVRFYIPLTNSIIEAKDHEYQVADMMLVLDDVWFKEAGLAQKLTLGIKTAEYKYTEGTDNYTKYYREVGVEPTLSSIKTDEFLTIKYNTNGQHSIINGSELNVEDGHILVDDNYINGPLGFTFDFNATHSKINSTSYVISGNGLSSYIQENLDKTQTHWPMF
jgi:hypothetical protein